MVEKYIDKEFQINKEFLDSIDFNYFLKTFLTLSEMMSAVKHYSKIHHYKLPPELEGEVFNYYSEEDFKDYLLERYHNLYFYPVEDYLIDFRSEEK